MKMALNATPLIYLAKSGLFKILDDSDNYYSTQQVAEEVLLPDFSEYLELKNFMDQHVGIIKTKIAKEFTIDGLGAGEASVLSLAKDRCMAAIIDDKLGRACAAANNIRVYHTTFFIFRSLEKNTLQKKDALSYLDKLVLAGWRCDIETYIRIRNKIEAF